MRNEIKQRDYEREYDNMMWSELELILLVVAWALFRVAEALGRNKEKECDHQYENKREQRKLEKKARNKREKDKKRRKHKKIARGGGKKGGEEQETQRDNEDERSREREKERKILSSNSNTDNTGKEKEKAESTIATSDLYYLLTLVIEQQTRIIAKNNEKMTDTPPATMPPAPTQNVILDFSQFLAAQIPLPGQPGAPYFDGKEVIKFVRSWERFLERFKIADQKMVNELVDYCEMNTGEYVVTIIDEAKREIHGANLRESWWPKVQTGLLKNFKSDDSEQQRNTVAFLRSLSSDKPFRMKAEEVERYIRTYQQISNTLVSEMRLTAFDQMICFLQGLPVLGLLKDKKLMFNWLPYLPKLPYLTP